MTMTASGDLAGAGTRVPISTPPRPSTPTHGFGTLAVHAGAPHDPVTGAVIEPISLSTTFAQRSVGVPVGEYEYSRSGNPNRDNFEAAVAALEHAKHAIALSSGSATTATILQSLPPGSHVISVSDVYGGTHRYFTQVAHAHGIRVTFTPELEVDIRMHLTPATKLVWIESPSNPTLRLTDVRAVAAEAHAHGVQVVVDNTFLSPYVQNPLDHGADMVIHSVTKYINGHSDVVMGVVALNDDVTYKRLRFLQNAIGAVPSAFDCWLAHRGLKTLHLRARAASTNAAAVAAALEAEIIPGDDEEEGEAEFPQQQNGNGNGLARWHARASRGKGRVLAVNYPGSASHPQRHVALAQHRDGLGGGMLSFRIRGGQAAADRFCQLTRIFTLAESLGGIESLIEVPSSMTHAGIPREDRLAVGVFDDLVRVSCGIEDAEDLVNDVLRALHQVVAEAEAGLLGQDDAAAKKAGIVVVANGQ